MLFSLYCKDGPKGPEVRKNIRPQHVAYLETHADQLVYAGPLLDENDSPIGSLIVIEVADRAAAEAFSVGDPYAKEGAFENVEIVATRQVFPKQ
ncbi:MAG: hypothetical protein CMO80_21210 [Verrucomicrobiales bacterium]|nr:hypothetical protein [Verrucomicrobiales bacterium]|tara:strand:- start:1825 stop:2106 length:282 start_codon:yes stop_codon:yes gene_type:complete